jgi:hypothetical protein
MQARRCVPHIRRSLPWRAEGADDQRVPWPILSDAAAGKGARTPSGPTKNFVSAKVF